jgi:hypothetical protein
VGRVSPESTVPRRGAPRAAPLLALALVALAALAAAPAHAARVRAAYAYHYMPASHVDSLADRGFTRVLVRWLPDSLDARGAGVLRAWQARGVARGIEVVPDWPLQSPARLRALGGTRRYAPADGRAGPDVPCPLDAAHWRSALVDRAEEFLAAAPLRRVAVDLELYGAARHHWDGGPCRCEACVADYLAATPAAGRGARPGLAGLAGFQEARLTALLVPLLRGFAARHPGVEIGVLDLDLEAAVHRAVARALARSGVPAADYCERSYGAGAAPLPAARRRLDALGLAGAPLIGGLWLQRFTPEELVAAMRAVDGVADGTWIFTTYSLWQDPARLAGPYTLRGGAAETWRALARGNAAP